MYISKNQKTQNVKVKKSEIRKAVRVKYDEKSAVYLEQSKAKLLFATKNPANLQAINYKCTCSYTTQACETFKLTFRSSQQARRRVPFWPRNETFAAALRAYQRPS